MAKHFFGLVFLVAAPVLFAVTSDERARLEALRESL